MAKANTETKTKIKIKLLRRLMDQKTRIVIISVVIVVKITKVSVASLLQKLRPNKVMVILQENK